MAAPADVVMVNGTIYDVGKGAMSVSSGNNINMANRQGDSALCWAATASNLFQHWQDKYLPAGSTAPNGLNGTNYTTPTGTRYLSIFDTFIDNFYNYGGNYGVAVEWYFHGKDIAYMLKSGANKGPIVNRSDVSSWQYSFENDKYTTPDPSYQFNTLAGLKGALDNAFSKQGIGVYLSLSNKAYNGGHAISCWGYETDETGTIVALMVTDSDDKQFGARRLAVEQKADGYIYLETSNPLGTYTESEGSYVLNSVSYLTDPLATTRSVSANTSLSTAVASSSAVTEAVEAKGTVTLYKSISLEAGSILAASGKANNNKLSITGNGGTALDAKLGSFVNIRDTALTIRNTSGNGLQVAAEAYIDNGSVDISNVGGTGITVGLTYSDNAVYLEMDGNDFVKINNNKTGGLVVKSVWENYVVKQARVDISHNKTVEISGNVAAWKSGAGAQINGILTMTDNDSVTFSGNRSTYNYEAGGGGLEVKNSNGKGNVTISDNGVVLFENNEGNGYGGGVKTSGILTIKDNDEVTFSGNASTHASYGGGALAVTGGSGSGEATISGNDKVVFDGNSSKAAGSAILATGKSLTLSGNGEVEFINNSGGNGSVIRNDANSIVEIAHNDSVTFSGNTFSGTDKYDISNDGTLYLCTDAGQSINFEYGIKNDDKGVAYLGKDSAGNVSTGGTYSFSNGMSTVSLTSVAATVNNGGEVSFDRYQGDVLIQKTEITNLKAVLSQASLTLSDVSFSTGSCLEVDLGYYAENSFLTVGGISFTDADASSVGVSDAPKLTMSINLDLDQNRERSAATGLETETMRAFIAKATPEATITLKDFLLFDLEAYWAQVDASLTLSGKLTEDQPLVIDVSETQFDKNTIIAKNYVFDHQVGTVLYYLEIPEPATATLSLLALAALAARRRRKAA